MKRIQIFVFGVLLISAGKLYGQTPASMQLANHIAQKMKDTLGLTARQQSQIYDINISLANQKLALRQQYRSMDSLSIYTQRIEKKRDSLYQQVLQPEKYGLYLQKKRYLVTAN